MVAAVALGIFVVACSIVGVRLVWVAAHGAGSPAWSCGLGYVFISILGYPLTLASGLNTGQVGDVHLGLAAAGLLFVAAGLSAFFAFTLTTFRLRDRWAWLLTLGAIATLAVVAFAQIGALGAADPSASSGRVCLVHGRITGAVSTACYLWITLEGFMEWSRSRRRLALGLSDPVVSNRFFLWGLHGAAVTLLNVYLLVLTYSMQQGTMSLSGQIAMSIFGTVSAAASSLAFFPPRIYLDWLRGRAAAAVEGA